MFEKNSTVIFESHFAMFLAAGRKRAEGQKRANCGKRMEDRRA
jgi:hypothetical protein